MRVKPERAAEPTVMPCDREAWAKQLHLSNFVNTYYQFRDLGQCADVHRVLIVGPGQGLDTQVLRWRGYEVTTIDIDRTFNPDHVASVHDLSAFTDGQFDAVIASHVLEHLADPYFDRAVAELARVARFALVYLPIAGSHGQVRLRPGVRGWSWSIAWDLFNPFHRPTGLDARYCENQHFWEIGMRGYRVADVTRRLERQFDVIAAYRNPDWIYSYNFVLRSRRRPADR